MHIKSGFRKVLVPPFTCSLILLGRAIQKDNLDSSDAEGSGFVMGEREEICLEGLTDKMRQFGKEGPFPTLAEAERFTAMLELGGYDGWRIPTKWNYSICSIRTIGRMTV